MKAGRALGRWAAAVPLVALVVLLAGCPKATAPTDAGAGAVFVPLPPDAGAPARAAEVDDLWARAGDEDGGVPDDLARLAQREGVAGLIERGAHPALRRTAARALGYTPGFGALAWLGAVAVAGDDAPAALAALESAVQLASQPRRPVDAEDADEIRAGCEKLQGIAKDPKGERVRRVLAVRALRMLADKGCAKEMPTDLDAR